MTDKRETIVIVEEKAFMGMFLAAVEAFPTRFRPGKSRRPNGTSPEGEVFGLLLGQRTIRKNNLEVFNVALAVPNQIIYERSAGGVTASVTHINYLRELTKIFPAYQFLGTFHSHPYKRKNFHPTAAVEHSDGDVSSTIAMADATGTSFLEIIFASPVVAAVLSLCLLMSRTWFMVAAVFTCTRWAVIVPSTIREPVRGRFERLIIWLFEHTIKISPSRKSFAWHKLQGDQDEKKRT